MQCPHHLILVRPRDFSFNPQAAQTNSFQHQPTIDENINAQVLAEFEELIEVLNNHHISITIFDSPPNKIVPDAVFPNNWFAVLPDGQCIVFPMYNANRRDEVNQPIIDYINQCFNITANIDLSSNWKDGFFLEGTGSIIFDHDEGIAYACESPRTSIPLFEQLCQTIGYRPVSFAAYDLAEKPIYHTNVVMSIGTSTAIVCLEAIQDLIERNMIKQMLVMSHKRLVEIGYNQLNAFCANSLLVKNSLGKPVWLMSTTAFQAFTLAQLNLLEEDGLIVTASIPVIERVGGGSLRCLLAGIHAQGK